MDETKSNSNDVFPCMPGLLLLDLRDGQCLQMRLSLSGLIINATNSNCLTKPDDDWQWRRRVLWLLGRMSLLRWGGEILCWSRPVGVGVRMAECPLTPVAPFDRWSAWRSAANRHVTRRRQWRLGGRGHPSTSDSHREAAFIYWG